ncbi:MAG: hypothetical protein LBH92_03340 [Bacteroidales bacterium]|nr:hypothetical protein [Bacteroidales bacterium]
MSILLGLILLAGSVAFAQSEENGNDYEFDDFSLYRIADSLAQRDTLPSLLNFPDSLASVMHSMSAPFSSTKNSNKGALETQITRVSDSSTFDIKNRIAYLYKNGDITYGSVNMKADYIEIDFFNNEVYATGVLDSLGNLVGTPVFSENGQEYRAERMRYNFDTKKGLIYNIITQEGEGYMHGTVVKKDPDDVMNVKDGWYTTCDLDHPHYGLKFSKAKVIPDNKIVVGPAYLIIEDVPTPLALPFALIPNKKTRKSGIIVPRIDQIDGMGFGLANGGFYWYINDYMDLTLIGDIFTRGSWAFKPTFKYKKLYKFDGKMNVGYGRNLKGVYGTKSYYDEKDFRVQWSHRQDPKAHPVNTFSADVNIQSSGYSKFNPESNEDYLKSTYSSSINFSTSFWKFNYSLSAGFTQNTQTNTLDVKLPEMSLATGQLYPFRRKTRTGNLKWYEIIYVKYNMNAKNEIRSADSTLLTGSMYPKMNYGMKHTIPIGSDFKLFKVLNGNFNFNYTEYWYGKTIRKRDYADTDYDIINGEILTSGLAKTDTLYDFSSTRDFNLSLSTNTKLYGMYTLAKGPVKAVRHVMTPSLSFRYNPDFGTPFWGNYDTYIDKNGESVIYSIYEGRIYGGPGQGMSSLLNFELNNNVEMKIASKRDTISGTKKIKLIDYFKINIGYDFAKDSLNWTKLQLSGQTTIFEGLKLSYRGVFDPYVIIERDDRNVNLNITEWKANKRLFRFNDASWELSFDYRLNPDTFKKKNGQNQNKASDIPEAERIFDPEYYIDWSVPWNFMIGYSLKYTHILNYKTQEYTHERTTIQSIRVSGDVSLTPKWKLAFSSGYDFAGKTWNYTTIDIYRDLHCWEMSFHWVPFGGRKQWNFQINIKANMLKDLKVTKRKDFRENW